MKQIINRSGRTIPFDEQKIFAAISKAFESTGELSESGIHGRKRIIEFCMYLVIARLNEYYLDPVDIESVQDEVETVLMERYPRTAKSYILYRNERHRHREQNSRLMHALNDIVTSDARHSDQKRENANIDGDTPMGAMLKIGSESSKAYCHAFVLPPGVAEAHDHGDIHIHDLDFLPFTMTCCQIDLTKLFSKPFSTGHGSIRTPNDIASYGALAAIVLQGNQNDMHGGQSIPSFDRDMAPGVAKTFRKRYIQHLEDILDTQYSEYLNVTRCVNQVEEKMDVSLSMTTYFEHEDFRKTLVDVMVEAFGIDENNMLYDMATAEQRANRDTRKATHQAMQAFVHNLCTMHSRAGAQVPFSSINYGTDTSLEGRLVIRCLLQSTLEGLGSGETAIFPIQIFKVKKGVSAEPGDANYDLFQLACKVSARRLFPNFSFLDAPFNLAYYREGDPATETAYMGCRTRVMGNEYDTEREITPGRGNLSFTSINLPRLAMASMPLTGTERRDDFFKRLDKILLLVLDQLLDRMAIQGAKKVRNFPFLMGQGVWIDSENLSPDDSIAEIIKHGTLSIGFIGLAEALVALVGKHHGESEEAQELGLHIIRYMRKFCDRKSAELGLNITLLATPAEGLAGRFVKLDRTIYGIKQGINDKPYYTNSFHIPVGFELPACRKIELEAPYHALTNAGHITYVELDGDPSGNLEAFEAIIRCMASSGIGYGAINHPVDRDPACGYTGIIGRECPKCHRTEADAAPFERIRRITGYLVGSLERFNDAKLAEVNDRVKHSSI